MATKALYLACLCLYLPYLCLRLCLCLCLCLYLFRLPSLSAEFLPNNVRCMISAAVSGFRCARSQERQFSYFFTMLNV